ncbi:ectoine/hydroxyectoine ABC transporter permease subunit EhuD [Streptomyces sp. YC504]|uniref:Ectoine/hydroxyectoine ABC transporter permease subunit EhuD n=1 Tax=Streptomyces mesophilus TaxID=1775132 RepID=A0A6G4XHK8_9ACTN|nr:MULTISPECIES: ectoine/hydroxyectoine ABC transporter permease subunit EhuD [Streptomyces]NGO77035.1 ectoine/hydroxyectoine ABC transporter permease subunit EhuD [Streptomyces mesophilus]
MSWDWSNVDAFMPRFWDGVLVTLQALAGGALIAFVLGLVWAVALRAPQAWIRWPVAVFTEFIRNTPLLVQLFFLFYVVPSWGPSMSPLVTGIVGLGLHYSTYTSEVYRAGIEGVPVGQWEAATALSLPKTRTWTAVILPQAVRRVVPALGNYVIVMLKESPQLAAIGALEMLGEARGFSNETFTFEAISVVGIAFIVIAYPASVLLRVLERRLVR